VGSWWPPYFSYLVIVAEKYKKQREREVFVSSVCAVKPKFIN